MSAYTDEDHQQEMKNPTDPGVSKVAAVTTVLHLMEHKRDVVGRKQPVAVIISPGGTRRKSKFSLQQIF